MATNAENEDDKSVKDENIAEEDQNDEQIVDAGEDSEGDEGQEVDETDKDNSKKEKSDFNKGEGFDWLKGDSVEEAFDNLKTAYQNSTAQVLKWKRKARGKVDRVEGEDIGDGSEKTGRQEPSPILRQAERREIEAMNKEYDNFLGDYPTANELGNAEKLEKRVQSISKAIQEDEGREPTFAEVLSLAATSLGWKKDTSGKVAEAMKDAAASSTRSSTPKAPPKSKVTAAQIKVAKKFSWAQGLSDAEIAKELEPHAV